MTQKKMFTRIVNFFFFDFSGSPRCTYLLLISDGKNADFPEFENPDFRRSQCSVARVSDKETTTQHPV